MKLGVKEGDTVIVGEVYFILHHWITILPQYIRMVFNDPCDILSGFLVDGAGMA